MGPAWRSNYSRYKRLFLTFFSRYRERQDVKMFLEILLSLITISLFSLLALRPTLITIAELIIDIESKKGTVAVMDAKIEDLGRAQKLYDQEIRRIKLLEDSVPKEPTPEGFIRQIEGLSAKHAVGIISMSLEEVVILGKESPAQKADNTGRLSFSVSTSADYPQLYSFLKDLEKMRRPLNVHSLSVSTSTTREGTFLVLVVDGISPFLRKEFLENNE